MRTWVLDRQAEADLQVQLDYLMEHGAVDAAERLSARIKAFLRDYLAVYPATGISGIRRKTVEARHYEAHPLPLRSLRRGSPAAR